MLMLICPLSRISIFSLLTLLLLVFRSESIEAQSSPTASKEAAISFFGTYSRVSTDRESEKDNGFTVGFAYTRYLHWLLTPSLEVRSKIATGGTVSEKTFGGGIRVEHRFKNFYPYANFFGSYGKITFTNPITSVPGPRYYYDDSTVYSTGAGLDYDITSNWAARVDYQFEHWHTGLKNTFTPQIFSIGILYRIPFKPYRRE
jgi:opacity protein-like surface antigen